MDIEAIQKQTAETLGVPISEVSYITEELLNEYRENAKEVDGSDGNSEGEKRVNGKTGLLDTWGTYGNSITFDSGSGGKCYWKQGPKGTPNYGCGTSESWSAGKQWASHINPRTKCTDGKQWYFIGNYDG